MSAVRVLRVCPDLASEVQVFAENNHKEWANNQFTRNKPLLYAATPTVSF